MPTELKSPSGCRSTGEAAGEGEEHCCVGLVASHRDPRLTIYPHNGWLPHPHPPVYFTISPYDRVRGPKSSMVGFYRFSFRSASISIHILNIFIHINYIHARGGLWSDRGDRVSQHLVRG